MDYICFCTHVCVDDRSADPPAPTPSMSRATVKPCVGRFLLECLEEESLSHLLQWENKQNGTFRLLWLHAGRANFDKEYHQEIFHRYREYKGRVAG